MLRTLALLAIAFPVTSNAESVQLPSCEVLTENMPDAPKIRIIESKCHKNSCHVVFGVDLRIENFNFMDLLLRRTSEPKFNLKLAIEINESIGAAWFDGDASMFQDLYALARFSDDDHCVVVSKVQLTHNKKRNEVDATEVALIR